MARGRNLTDSKNPRITVSSESVGLLAELAKRGIYGRTIAEVAGRFVDRALQEFVERPKLTLRSSRTRSGKE